MCLAITTIFIIIFSQVNEPNNLVIFNHHGVKYLDLINDIEA